MDERQRAERMASEAEEHATAARADAAWAQDPAIEANAAWADHAAREAAKAAHAGDAEAAQRQRDEARFRAKLVAEARAAELQREEDVQVLRDGNEGF
jgi:hypothetical protein